MKEAYTKALGLGLGFDFSRIQYNPTQEELLIDGESPKGWEFTRFELKCGSDAYQGVAAEYVGGRGTKMLSSSSVVRHDAATFIQVAVEVLGE